MTLRERARGKLCMVRAPGVCNFNSETTILAHMNGAGMGIKHHDIFGAWCCSACHDYVDGRTYPTVTREHRDKLLLDGIIRTQQQLMADGVLIVRDGSDV